MAESPRVADPFADALQVQADAAVDGFDWDDIGGLWDKLQEEIGELREAASHAHRSEELGDVLFTVVNLARKLGIDSATALEATTAKFRRRYAHVQAQLPVMPPIGTPERLIRMEALWQEAKKLEEKPATRDSHTPD